MRLSTGLQLHVASHGQFPVLEQVFVKEGDPSLATLFPLFLQEDMAEELVVGSVMLGLPDGHGKRELVIDPFDNPKNISLMDIAGDASVPTSTSVFILFLAALETCLCPFFCFLQPVFEGVAFKHHPDDIIFQVMKKSGVNGKGLSEEAMEYLSGLSISEVFTPEQEP